jgi:hypothetical protein
VGRSITLDVPDETYEVIRARATARGATPEQIVLEHLIAALEPAGRPPSGVVAVAAATESLDVLIGTIACEAADVAERHDEYIGRALVGAGGTKQRPTGG